MAVTDSSTAKYADNEVYDNDYDEEPGVLSWTWFMNLFNGFKYDFWYYINVAVFVAALALLIYYLFVRRKPAAVVPVAVVQGGGRFGARLL